MSEREWERHLAEARPRVVAALLRSLRDLEIAEEAYQEACLRALDSWARQGPPKDPVAWLILVGRNAAIDGLRRARKWQELGDLAAAGSAIADEDPEARLLDGLERRPFGDDVLRLFFVCCHPALGPADQIALALKVVAGMTVPEIARAFLLKPKALEQRLTRAKKRLAEAQAAYGAPSAEERSSRLPAVSSMIYLLFNEGYSASGGRAHVRRPLCEEAIRLARLLLRAVPGEPEVMGLLALLLLQHARCAARLDEAGEIVALADQDRQLWRTEPMAEARILVEKALRRQRPGPLQIQAAIAAMHASATRAEATDWREIDRLYQALETLQPTPVVTLNRAVAVHQAEGPEMALQMIEPLAASLDGYFHFHGVRGALLAELDRHEEARRAWRRALELHGTAAERSHIETKLAALPART